MASDGTSLRPASRRLDIAPHQPSNTTNSQSQLGPSFHDPRTPVVLGSVILIK